MRTLELGRPMLRATNTGVTAAIDPRAHVIAELPILTEGALDAVVQGTEGTTLYTRIGNLGIFFGCLSTLAACAIRRRQTRSTRRLPASPPL
jgi:apolipoprotein N-acyltransferase